MYLRLLFFLALFSLSSSFLPAQSSLDYAVQLWAEVQVSPPAITIHWLPKQGVTTYVLYRKGEGDGDWGSPLGIWDAGVTFYEDADVEPGVPYEYKLQANGSVVAVGYLYSGIALPAVHQRGRMLLLVDSVFSDTLSEELLRLREDLEGDGWIVLQRDVDREASPQDIKGIIVEEYYEGLEPLRALFCIGQVPVPYSGDYAPDGHANHKGAWPTDGYYADINGVWTDEFVNDTLAAQERHHNVPGDGKFDPSFFPSPLEMEIGRVDFSDMPAFSLSEVELLKFYFDKDHAFRMGEMEVGMRAVIDDNFGAFGGEAFAASAWKSFSPLLHPDQVSAGDYRSSMDTASYLWSYGCGGGSYTSCNGVGTTNDFAGDSLQGIFSCLFGSYFGDWDSQNNLLRAALAQGTILTNCWSGRPHWYFHHMAMGRTIGYASRISMNNDGILYHTPLTFLSGIVGMALMGDPSLRLHMVPPPSNLSVDFDGRHAILSWEALADTSARYYIYRRDEAEEEFSLLTEEPLAGTSFVDSCLAETGLHRYMLRAELLQASPSGTYYNLSQGIFADLEVDTLLWPQASFSAEVLDSGWVALSNSSVEADTWQWFFGDGTGSTAFEPQHQYVLSGDYDLVLIASNACFSDTFSLVLNVLITSLEKHPQLGIKVYPNPVSDGFFLRLEENPLSEVQLQLFDAQAREVEIVGQVVGPSLISLFLPDLLPGTYYLWVITDRGSWVTKLVKE